jgi:hypothetical protein
VELVFRGTFLPLDRASDRPIAIACLRLFTFRPLPDLSVPFFRRRIALSTSLLALSEYFRPEDFFAAIFGSSQVESGHRARFVQNAHLHMTRREGNERAAAIRLTSGIHPETARLVLERCLAGDLPPSSALRELREMTGEPERVRSLVDQVTDRAAVLSRAGDRLLQDRVDELTQLVVEPERI